MRRASLCLLSQAVFGLTDVVLKDTGHWVLEERPRETTDALQKFL